MNLPLKLKCQTNFSFHHKNLCKARERTEKPTPFTTSYYQKQLKPISVAQTQLPKTSTNTYKVEFKTLEGCKLGISSYPYFEYDAKGGAGKGIGTPVEDLSEDEISAWFDPKEIYIPPLSSATTRFLGLPLPPFLKIEIVPEVFKGCINKQTGKVDLEFRAEFWFSVGSVYRAPALLVATVLTSEESRGGRRLDREGSCRLVGVARVDPIDDLFINTFLQLPTECVAIINAVISFSNQSS